MTDHYETLGVQRDASPDDIQAAYRRAASRTHPAQWQRKAAEFHAAHGRRRRVFCASLADVFDNEVPPEWRADLFDLIASTPDLDWLLLTKRIGNAHTMIGEALINLAAARGRRPTDLLPSWPWPNVWLGATVVNQEEADRDIPKLLRVRAAIRFLSMEPLLGHVTIPEVFMAPLRIDGLPYNYPDGAGLIDWIIAGAESGPKARPAQTEWFQSLRKQCRATGVAFHMKQLGHIVHDHGMSSPGSHWPPGMVRSLLPRITNDDPAFEVRLADKKGGDPAEWPEDLRVREFPNGTR